MNGINLSTRLTELLEQSIEDYIRTAVPIVSGNLARARHGVNVKSPATIRSDLKILEEMGFLHQVHTSGGRIPTVQGYRFYVNRVMGSMQIKPGEFAFAVDQICARVGELPCVIDEVCKKLESTFEYPIVVRRQFDKLIVTDIAIVPLLAGSTLVLIKTNAGSISQAIEIDSVNERRCQDGAAALCTRCKGLTLREMLEKLPRLSKELKKDLAYFENLCRKLGEKLEQTIEHDVETRVNITKLLDMPNVRQLGKVIDDGKALAAVLGASETVVIGEDASIIKFDYQVGGETIANIGIVGPDRMDYKNLIGALYSLKNVVEENRKMEGGKNDRKRIG